MGQGKIDEILSSKPDDRRQIFEEAAGISKYRYRKEEAQRKLVRTNENLDRVYETIAELEGRVEPLKIQSEKAKKYLTFKEELKTYEVNDALRIIEGANDVIGGLDEKSWALLQNSWRKQKMRLTMRSAPRQNSTRRRGTERSRPRKHPVKPGSFLRSHLY